jgi:hypothetical protein
MRATAPTARANAAPARGAPTGRPSKIGCEARLPRLEATFRPRDLWTGKASARRGAEVWEKIPTDPRVLRALTQSAQLVADLMP